MRQECKKIHIPRAVLLDAENAAAKNLLDLVRTGSNAQIQWVLGPAGACAGEGTLH